MNKYFNKEKQEKALKWLEDKWLKKDRACEVCKNTHWQLAEDLIMPLPFIGGGLTVGGNSYPSVLLICNNCGNSKFFNAVIMKIEGEKHE